MRQKRTLDTDFSITCAPKMGHRSDVREKPVETPPPRYL
jgi:hypothetical protein